MPFVNYSISFRLNYHVFEFSINLDLQVKIKLNYFMANLMNEVARHLNDDVIIQLSKQLGAQDPNQVKRASQGVSELLLNAISRSANNPQQGGGLYGAIEKDHDGGILGDLMNVLGGKKKVSNPKTLNGTGIVNHLLGKRQLEAAQMIQQMSGLDIFKSGVLMQLVAPVIMGVVGQQKKSSSLDLGGLAKVLMGGVQQPQQASNQGGGSIFTKLLDMDGDGNVMDDLMNIGMKILTK